MFVFGKYVQLSLIVENEAMNVNLPKGFFAENLANSLMAKVISFLTHIFLTVPPPPRPWGAKLKSHSNLVVKVFYVFRVLLENGGVSGQKKRKPVRRHRPVEVQLVLVLKRTKRIRNLQMFVIG